MYRKDQAASKLKRFSAAGRNVKKVDTHVAFPMHLNVIEQPSEGAKQPPKAWEQLDPRAARPVRYELFGAVEHQGTYRDGHYTAFVRGGGSAVDNPEGAPPVWNHFSDSKVTAVNEVAVQKAQAFLLFYSRAS